MKLYIKNMVCCRCETIVKSELEKIGIQYTSVNLGEVNTTKIITPLQRARLYDALQQSGLELLDDVEFELIEKLKKSIIYLEQYSDENLKTSFSDFINLCVNDNFSLLNTLFAEIKGVSIEKYIIKHKIEQVKELLVHNKLNLNEIALKMHYGSTAQLSNQFKSITGLTLFDFSQLQHSKISIFESN
jgi:AraC-like DNA-binding protein